MNQWDSTSVRVSYPARTSIVNGMVVTEWKEKDYVTNVVYSDFVGVMNYSAGGFAGEGTIYPVHEGKGYNRLFGDSSVRWTKPGQLTKNISATVPSQLRLSQYFAELDTLR